MYPRSRYERRAAPTVCHAVRTVRYALFIVSISLLLTACSRRSDDVQILEEEIHGFRLGETKDGLFERAGGRVNWHEMPNQPGDYRGDLYLFSGGLVHEKGIDHIRLSFVDGRLMEIIAYYRNTGVSQLNALKSMLEQRYDTQASSPDGTIEMTYKTYWLSAPGMSIAIRRITKKQSTELYVQYLHGGLAGRLRERNDNRRPAAH